jgi:hypothetical protein
VLKQKNNIIAARIIFTFKYYGRCIDSLISLTPRIRDLLENLTGSEHARIFPESYRTSSFFATLEEPKTCPCPELDIQAKLLVRLSSLLCLGLPISLFISGDPHQNPVHISLLPHICYIHTQISSSPPCSPTPSVYASPPV